jgi:hypothetical protein
MSAGRRCTICTSFDRTEIEKLLLTGLTPNRRISAQFKISEASVRRHRENHMAEQIELALQVEEALVLPGDFGQRIIAIADGLARTRERAEAAGQHSIALKASQTEIAALNTILTRLGITDQSSLDIVLDAQELARGIKTVALRNPEVAGQLRELLEGSKASNTLIQTAKAIEAQALRGETL